MKKRRTANRDDLQKFDQLAESFVREAGMTRPPVAPLRWCQDSRLIQVHESDLLDECDGLLVFRNNKFHLFYRPDPRRVRFTQAHEVAHYLIDEHHTAIRYGAAEHVCKTDFVTDSIMEKEANAFASGLLMPGFMFAPQCPDPSFRAISSTAARFDVSLTAAVLRTLTFTDLRAAVVVTEADRIEWYMCSDSLARSGVHTVKKGEPPPRRSKTLEVCRNLRSLPSEPIQGTKTFASDWFHNVYRDIELWEEVLPVSSHNQVITLLVWDD